MVMTFEEALIKRVGQFGRGQWLILSASSLCLIANAAAFFFWWASLNLHPPCRQHACLVVAMPDHCPVPAHRTFAAGNPVATHQWACSDPADSACRAVWQQDAPSNQDFCSLPADSRHWSSQGEPCKRPGAAQLNRAQLVVGQGASPAIPADCRALLLLVPADTLVARFNLVCGDAWKVQLTNSVRPTASITTWKLLFCWC